ncbi:MAG: cation-transporting P-type ATPase, partial [Patescibacteria group bacterium]
MNIPFSMAKEELFPEPLLYQKAAIFKHAELFQYLKTTDHGISQEESMRRATFYGPNRIKTDDTHWYDIFIDQCKSSFVYLLLIASVLSFFIGDHIEAIMIAIFLGVNIGLGFFQEMRALHARSSLRKYIVHHIRVRRAGSTKDINAEEVVVGDMLIINAGDIVPADGVWVSTTRLEVDESILSGESLPIKKTTTPLTKAPADYFKALNCGFSQTKVVAGTGTLLVTAIGDATVAGSLFVSTNRHHEPSEFERGIQRLSTMLFALVSITILVLVVLKIFLQHETSMVELVVFGIAMVVGAVPEALPFVTTFSMS